MDSDLSITNRKFLFLNIKSINSPLNKKYKILPYSQKIIRNENNVFDLIHFLGNKKKYNQLKKIYTDEQNKIKKEILIQKKKEKFYKNPNIINIKTFDIDKINIHSPMSIMEGNFISGLIQYSKNKQKKMKKMTEHNKKNKFVFKRASTAQDLTLNNYFRKKNRNSIKGENKMNLLKDINNFVEDNKDISDISNSNNTNSKTDIKSNKINGLREESKNSDNYNKLRFSSIFNLLDEEYPESVENKNEFRKTINSIFFRSYNKLNRDKKSLSAENFFGIQSKKTKLDGNKDQILNLRHKKLSKLFFSKLFNEENKIVGNLNEINNNLINLKYSNHAENLKNFNTVSTHTFRTHRKNVYKTIKENLTTLHKKIYEFPVVNKYIYGSRNPLSLFSKLKIKSKIDTNLSEN